MDDSEEVVHYGKHESEAVEPLLSPHCSCRYSKRDQRRVLAAIISTFIVTALCSSTVAVWLTGNPSNIFQRGFATDMCSYL